MPRDGQPAEFPALNEKDTRLLEAWDLHLAEISSAARDRDVFLSFGGTSRLERLRKILNIVRPEDAGPLRLAIRHRKGLRWRSEGRAEATRSSISQSNPSVPQDQLPKAWRRVIREMEGLRATLGEGFVSLDDRTPPSPKVIASLKSTLRVYANVCKDAGVDAEISQETLRLWQEARIAAENKNISIVARLKELLIFGAWCELDDDILDSIGELKNRYLAASRRDRKEKETWLLNNDLGIVDVWTKAQELLVVGLSAPVGTATRAWRILDACCLALSIVCPLRIGDLHRIEIGTQLHRNPDGWSLRIETAKTGLIYDRDALWPELTPFLDAVVMLDMPCIDFWEAYDRRVGTPLFARDGNNGEVAMNWPSDVWRRYFGIGEHIVRTLWHEMMFDSEDDDQWIALALCGQGNGRTAMEYIVKGNRIRARKRGRSKLRMLRTAAMANLK